LDASIGAAISGALLVFTGAILAIDANRRSARTIDRFNTEAEQNGCPAS
jgi:hypothetical protein